MNAPVPVKERPAGRNPKGQSNITHEDVQAINDRLAYLRKHYGNLRVQQAAFHIPWPIGRSQYEQYRKEAIDKWLRIMEQKGWELKSKVHVKGMKPAYGFHGDQLNVPLLDQRMVSVLAAFQAKKVDNVQIEVLVADSNA